MKNHIDLENDLSQLIRDLQPIANDTAHENALRQINIAVEDFMVSSTIDQSMATKELISVSKALATLEQRLDSLSPIALQAICNAIDAPIGKLRRELNATSQAITQAIEMVKRPRGRPPNPPRVVLAGEVARILHEVLGIAPALTRNTEMITGKRNGAAFDRLLSLVLQLAGMPIPSDLYELMQSGLEHAKNPRGASLKPT